LYNSTNEGLNYEGSVRQQVSGKCGNATSHPANDSQWKIKTLMWMDFPMKQVTRCGAQYVPYNAGFRKPSIWRNISLVRVIVNIYRNTSLALSKPSTQLLCTSRCNAFFRPLAAGGKYRSDSSSTRSRTKFHQPTVSSTYHPNYEHHIAPCFSVVYGSAALHNRLYYTFSGS
jgi:hypothetical protein